jgi:hypothetical protein
VRFISHRCRCALPAGGERIHERRRLGRSVCAWAEQPVNHHRFGTATRSPCWAIG